MKTIRIAITALTGWPSAPVAGFSLKVDRSSSAARPRRLPAGVSEATLQDSARPWTSIRQFRITWPSTPEWVMSRGQIAVKSPPQGLSSSPCMSTVAAMGPFSGEGDTVTGETVLPAVAGAGAGDAAGAAAAARRARNWASI